jgi:hypothetical protein
MNGCSNRHESKGLCHKHYARLRRNGKVELIPKQKRICSVEGCLEKHDAKGLCKKHYNLQCYNGGSHYRDNKQKHISNVRKWQASNPDKVKSSLRRWYINNRQKRIDDTRKWQLNNPDKVRAFELTKRCKPIYKLRRAIRSRLQTELKHVVKSFSYSKSIGCKYAVLQTHLEKQFKPGMNWNNYGKVWNLDHIVPMASFDLTNPEQVKICNHFTNLQPMWAKDNFSKLNKTKPIDSLMLMGRISLSGN